MALAMELRTSKRVLLTPIFLLGIMRGFFSNTGIRGFISPIPSQVPFSHDYTYRLTRRERPINAESCIMDER